MYRMDRIFSSLSYRLQNGFAYLMSRFIIQLRYASGFCVPQVGAYCPVKVRIRVLRALSRILAYS